MQREAVPPLPRVLPGAGCSIKKSVNFVTICADSAHAPIGTVRGQDDRFTFGLLMCCRVEDSVSACQVASGAAVDP